MKNKFDRITRSIERLIDKRCKGINQNYKRSYGRIRRELRRIYDEYEVNGQLSFDDLRKFRELERIDSLTARVLVGLFNDNKKIIDKLLSDTVDRTYKESIKTLDKGLEAITKPIVAKDIVRKEVAGRVWVERVDHQAGNLNYDVTSLIRAGMERGDSYTQIARDLKKKLAKDNASLNRLARTEGARVIEDSKYSTFEDIAKLDDVIVYKIWHTMSDEAVRSSHQAMEGVKVKFDENFTLPSGVTCLYPKTTGYPEEDINCRCYVEYVTEIKEEDLGYNDSEPIEIQDDQAIRSWISHHDKTYNLQKHQEHDPNSSRYVDGKSILNITYEQGQDLINNKAGTGELKRDRKGRWTKKEFINNDIVIGITDGEKTRRCSFDYKDKKWVHIVPRKEKS